MGGAGRELRGKLARLTALNSACHPEPQPFLEWEGWALVFMEIWKGRYTKEGPEPCPSHLYLSFKDQLTGCQDLTLFFSQLSHKRMPPQGSHGPALEVQPNHRGPHAPAPQDFVSLEEKGVQRMWTRLPSWASEGEGGWGSVNTPL